jgi:hypothetical protein
MLSLLLGVSCKEKDKSVLHKVSKKWYYDRNVWRVVIRFTNTDVVLPYKIKQHFKARWMCRNVLCKGEQIMYTDKKSIMILTTNNKVALILPDWHEIDKAEWLNDKQLLLNASGEVLIYQFDKDKTTLGKIDVCDRAYSITIKHGISAWISMNKLYISNAKFDCKPVVYNLDSPHGTFIHRIAIDSNRLIYVAYKDYIKIYSRSGARHQLNINKDITTQSDIKCILIHNDTLHVADNNGCIRAYTLDGKLLSRLKLNTVFTSMCITPLGSLAVSDMGRIFVV